MKKIILVASLMSMSSVNYAVELNYKTECIGSYTIDLPDNIEVALYPTDQYLQPKSEYPIYFADGKWAILSTFNYNDNNLSITANWNDYELTGVQKQINDANQNIKIKHPNDVEFWNGGNNIGFYAKGASSVFFIQKNKIYNFYTNSHYQGEENKGFDFYKQNAEAILNGFSTRELFEVPQSAGKCIPYGFVAGNDSTAPLNLTVSFRLNDHPDVVISFSENTRSFTNSLSFKAKDEINFFWNDNYDVNNDNIKNIKLLGFPVKYRPIKMDGRNGTAGFVEIRYKDESPSDYGYYGVVSYYSRNDKSQVNHPWLLLTVIGKRNEAKGHTPLTEDEIYQLAKTIEASIKRRYTEQ